MNREGRAWFYDTRLPAFAFASSTKVALELTCELYVAVRRVLHNTNTQPGFIQSTSRGKKSKTNSVIITFGRGSICERPVYLAGTGSSEAYVIRG